MRDKAKWRVPLTPGDEYRARLASRQATCRALASRGRLFSHARLLTFAAGAILTMLANTMMPEAFEHGGKLVGIMVTLGFAVAFAIHLLDA